MGLGLQCVSIKLQRSVNQLAAKVELIKLNLLLFVGLVFLYAPLVYYSKIDTAPNNYSQYSSSMCPLMGVISTKRLGESLIGVRLRTWSKAGLGVGGGVARNLTSYMEDSGGVSLY